MSDQLIKILLESGSVGVAIVALAILYKIVSNHLFHLTEVISKLEITMSKVLQVLEDKL